MDEFGESDMDEFSIEEEGEIDFGSNKGASSEDEPPQLVPAT